MKKGNSILFFLVLIFFTNSVFGFPKSHSKTYQFENFINDHSSLNQKPDYKFLLKTKNSILISNKIETDQIFLSNDKTYWYVNQIPDSLNRSRVDSIIPIEPISLIKVNSKKIDKFYLDRSNFFTPIQMINYETNSFLVDMGLPSNFYELSLLQSNNRSNSFFINEIQLNEPLTNLIDLRDLRFDELESIEIIFPTRSFLLSRKNDENSIVFNEWRRYSSIPLSKIRYIEAPYDNLFFDGLFNVNFTPKFNFEFGVNKHNALGRFLNSEKDLWAGKLKLTHYFSNQINVELVYRYTKSLVRFNEGINIFNPFRSQGESIENILYDNQRAIVINDDAYHKWTNHSVNFKSLFKIGTVSLSHLDFYYLQSLREYRDDEHKSDSVRIFNNHWSKVLGFNLKENLDLLFNKIELRATYEQIIIESPSYFQKVVDDLFSFYGFYLIDISNFIKPAFYFKLNRIKGTNKNLVSYGSDLNFSLGHKINLAFGASKFQKLFSYDERFYYNFNLNDYVSDIFLSFGRLTYSSSNFNLSSEVYYRKEDNPITQDKFYTIEQSNSIFNYPHKNFEAFGIKSDLSLNIWKLNIKLSLSYNDNQIELNGSKYHKSIYPRYQGNFELFYRDQLFKSSLDLLAGLRIKFFSSFSGRNFSPSKLTFVDVRTYNDSLVNFGMIVIPSNFTIDLVASGRVKESAIVYLSIENLLNRKFYYIPYYPANDIQFRFGINWEFYD